MPILSFGQRLRNNRMVAFLIMFVGMAGMGWLISKWSTQPGSREIRVGQRIMYQIMGAETLSKTEFYDRYPDGTPSDFVEFATSPAGEKLWPPAEGEGESSRDSLIQDRMDNTNRLRRPDILTFSAREFEPGVFPQIVYVPRDEEHKMIIKGYDRGDRKPEFVYDWKFPTDAGHIPLN